MKLEYIVIYENSSDEFDIELWIKVKFTVGDCQVSFDTWYKVVISYDVLVTLIKFMNIVMLE